MNTTLMMTIIMKADAVPVMISKWIAQQLAAIATATTLMRLVATMITAKIIVKQSIAAQLIEASVIIVV